MQEERRKTIEINGKLFNLLFEQQHGRVVENLGIISTAEGKPQYESYAHLVEDQTTINELLELANEELKNKHVLLMKIAKKLVNTKDISKDERDLLSQIISGFN